VEVDLVCMFRDLVRLETDLWNRVDARVHQEQGVPLAWLSCRWSARRRAAES
jgi:hypothetical protein